MGRKIEFNREEALTKAMEVFWQRGYKATSIRDLVNEMGINPGSIYNAFGDKHSLFIAAIKYYEETVTSRTLEILGSPGSPIGNIEKFFDDLINKSSQRKSMGCLVSNTAVELAPHDKMAKEIVNNILEKIENAFRDCLNRAVKFGELPDDTDTEALSLYLATFAHGIIVTGKSKIAQEKMCDVVNIVLSTVR